MRKPPHVGSYNEYEIFGLKACRKIARGPAARDFGCGQGGGRAPFFQLNRVCLRIAFAALVPCLLTAGQAAESGADVVVIYNSQMPESKQVAEHYAQRRQVPAGQIFGFKLPNTEAMTRAEFVEDLLQPLKQNLERSNLFTFAKEPPHRVTSAKIRYAAVCYGVPVKVLKDASLQEEGADKVREELRRNEASVDSELAALPAGEIKWTGPLVNPLYGATNFTHLHPTNGIWLVTRLDGPTAAIARNLVDKAMEAETNGLWGRAYFDYGYGLANTNYQLGDAWISGAAKLAHRGGFTTVLETNSGTFGAGFPMSQIACYAGWYAGHPHGPFLPTTMEFMPGAFAYHLHSFSAFSIRQSTSYWVGPLLAKGATATMGSVDEPYLIGTPNVALFFFALIHGRGSFGESAYVCQNVLSWQTTVVGDPLYRPFVLRPDLLHADLAKRQSKLLEWSHLRVVILNEALGREPAESARYLEALPLTRTSAVLKEKLGDVYWTRKNFSDALDTWEAVLKLNPTPMQKLRLLLLLAERRASYGPDRVALAFYQRIVKEFPDYADLLALYQKMLAVAKRVENKQVIELCEREIKRITAPPTNAPPAIEP